MSQQTLKQSDKKRAAILQAAREEFLTQGFRNTSMDQVAERADVSKRTVYNHFENKDALFRAVSVGLITEAKALPVEYDSEAPLSEQLLDLANREVNILTSETYISASRAILVESFELPGIVEQIAKEIPAGQDPVENWITAATDDGRLNCDDVKQATRHFYTLFKGVFFWPVITGVCTAPQGTEQQRYIENTIEMFLSYYSTSR